MESTVGEMMEMEDFGSAGQSSGGSNGKTATLQPTTAKTNELLEAPIGKSRRSSPRISSLDTSLVN